MKHCNYERVPGTQSWIFRGGPFWSVLVLSEIVTINGIARYQYMLTSNTISAEAAHDHPRVTRWDVGCFRANEEGLRAKTSLVLVVGEYMFIYM